MISTLWFLIKTVCLTVICLWLFSLGGTITIDAYGFSIATSLTVGIIVFLVIIYVISVFIRTLRAVFYTPQAIQNIIAQRSHKTGMRSLAYGLSAVAAGDVKAANYYAKKATHLLRDDYGLVALLSGLAARLKGDEKNAEKSFKTLLTHDETSFLGIRGLLQTAMGRGDYRYARVLARQAFDANPRQEWTIHTLYELELRHNDYDAALALLRQGVKVNAFDHDRANLERAAIYLVQNNIAEAYKSAPDFMPVTLQQVKRLTQEGKRRASLKLIKNMWPHNPHPELMNMWIAEAPKKARNNGQQMMAWVEDLWVTNKNDASSHLYTGEIAMRYHLEAQAKRFLQMALDIKATMRTYQYLARLNPDAGWHDHIAKGVADKAWVCRVTGKTYDEWQAFNDHGLFNTIQWMYPEERLSPPCLRIDGTPFFLDDVKKAA